eukprot:TRINITY_DN113615_c0_g1_i1.p1 TRINITY_DN113615_c0_g1~~TRINITY_DN113615_c0_g1_i1.p1  ORF type:complete len:905 (+),score=134.92 TRINITY_DN113615_c0_g1_i1:74-2788(+)
MTALSLVQKSVESRPESVALKYLRLDRTLGSLTYKQVWELSALVAVQLTGDVLGVAIDDGPYLAIAELAGWRRGMILVPLDPHDPVSRLQGVASEAAVTCIVTKDWGDAKKLSAVGVAIDLSLQVPLDGTATAPAVAETQLDPESAAYMWFTSGSTGKPKGVLVSHRAFYHWCLVKNGPHGISADSVVLIASASTFDPSIGDIFATWCQGAVVAVAPRMLFFANLGWAINQLGVSHITCTPSLWQSLEAGMELPTLTTLCLGGERSPQPLLDEWSPRVVLLNTYGTTECTVWQTLRRMRPADRATLVGLPYEGNEIKILQTDGDSEVVHGEMGEIVQGGLQVGIGYHNRPDLTAQKFVHLRGLEGRWYRTGDGGRIAEGGELEVMGRFDNQVKIRGMRVELGDIEAGVVKASAGLLSNCAVVLRGSFLQAYCQVSTAAAVVMHEPYCILPVVSDFLLQRTSLELPRHMLPSRFILLQQLPLTQNGKVNSKALPEVVEVSTKAASALTALEKTVASVWGEILGRSGIGPNDHFLALGGHSMSVLQVSRKLLALAAAAGQDTSPASHIGMLLAPEKLIHSPRLRLYCQMLSRGGVRLLDADAGEEVVGEEPVKEEDASDLRICYGKHKVKRPKASEEKDGEDEELDHAAWEQVPESTNGELLCRAAEAGLLPLVKVLLDEGAPVHGHLTGQHQRHGLTPLILSVSGNHLCCTERLLESGADANQRDSHGTPLLHRAAERGSERVIDMLLSRGADAEAIDTASRSTALHAAAKTGNGATAQALVDRKAFLDWLDRWNRTPLHWAVFHGHADICRTLLHGGASLDGVVGERNGRFLITALPCGVVPKRVAKRIEEDFLTPLQLARERFACAGPIVDMLSSWSGEKAHANGGSTNPALPVRGHDNGGYC